MKYSIICLLLISLPGYGQLLISDAKATAQKYRLGSYDYHEPFIGHQGYGAPIILTADGGAAFFGDFSDKDGRGGLLVKVDKTGKEQWKTLVRTKFDEMESQSVVQDLKGNYYVFMLSYDPNKYRGGCERIAYLDRYGKVLWDKVISTCELINNPTISYIRMLKDGRIYLRGHAVTDKPEEDQDPKYRYWEGWMNSLGKLTQKTGDVIDWANKEWEKKYKPD